MKGYFEKSFAEETLLVVDDDAIIRVLLRHRLSLFFREVIEAENGSLAARILSERKDVRHVISDYQMPSFDGIHLLGKIMQMEDLRRSSLRLIFHTSTPAELAEILGDKFPNVIVPIVDKLVIPNLGIRDQMLEAFRVSEIFIPPTSLQSLAAFPRVAGNA